MLIHPTVERLRALGLTAMADTLVELQNNPQAAEMLTSFASPPLGRDRLSE